jgi:hypothetical protein
MLFGSDTDKGQMIGGVEVTHETASTLSQLGHFSRILQRVSRVYIKGRIISGVKVR